MNETTKQTMAIIGALGIGIAGTYMYMDGQVDNFQDKVDMLVNENTALQNKIGSLNGQLALKPTEIVKEIPVEKIVDKIVEVEVIKEIEVEIEKEVIVEDETALKMVCDKLMYDDIIECKSEVEAEDKAIEKAIAEIRTKGLDMLEDEDMIEDEDDAHFIKIYDDFDEIEILESDYDDSTYSFEITAKVYDEETEDKTKVVFGVEVEDGDSELKYVEYKE